MVATEVVILDTPQLWISARNNPNPNKAKLLLIETRIEGTTKQRYPTKYIETECQSFGCRLPRLAFLSWFNRSFERQSKLFTIIFKFKHINTQFINRKAFPSIITRAIWAQRNNDRTMTWSLSRWIINHLSVSNSRPGPGWAFT